MRFGVLGPAIQSAAKALDSLVELALPAQGASKVVPGVRHPRMEMQCLPIPGNRLVGLSQQIPCVAQVKLGCRVVRPQPHSFPVMHRCHVQLALFHQERAKIVMRLGILWPQS